MNRLRSFVTFACVFLVAPALAQDISSGPTKGDKAPTLKVFDVTGMHKDKDVDYAAERKDRPTVYAFVQADQFDRPINRFMKTLDGTLKDDNKDAYVVAVMLTEKPDDTKAQLARVQMSVQYENTALTCFTGDKEGPKEWTLNSMADVTVIVANKGKVTATFGYNSINETDVPKVREALKNAK